MAESNLFKPQTSTSGIGKKSMDKGQFANPPAFPETSGFSGESAIKPQSSRIDGLERTPTSRKGRV